MKQELKNCYKKRLEVEKEVCLKNIDQARIILNECNWCLFVNNIIKFKIKRTKGCL